MQGRGCVLVGTIESGTIRKSDKVELIGHGTRLPASITEVQMFKNKLPQAVAGDHVGILVKGVKADQVRKRAPLF